MTRACTLPPQLSSHLSWAQHSQHIKCTARNTTWPTLTPGQHCQHISLSSWLWIMSLSIQSYYEEQSTKEPMWNSLQLLTQRCFIALIVLDQGSVPACSPLWYPSPAYSQSTFTLLDSDIWLGNNPPGFLRHTAKIQPRLAKEIIKSLASTNCFSLKYESDSGRIIRIKL